MEELGYTDDEMSALPITVVQEVDKFGGGSVMMWAAISPSVIVMKSCSRMFYR
jgi:hypothetical protein